MDNLRLSSDERFLLPGAKVALEHPIEGSLKLSIGQRIAERIYGRVCVAEEIGKVEQVRVDATIWCGAKTGHQREDMIGCPAEHEGAQNEANSSESFACPILRLRFVPQIHALRFVAGGLARDGATALAAGTRT